MEVTVAVLGTRFEAELMVGMLIDMEIPARASGDDAGAVDLALQSQGVRVLVNEADKDAALEILGIDANPPEWGRPLNRFEAWLVRLLGGGKPEGS